MFLPSLISLFFASGALASPFQFNGLTVTLSGPPSTVNAVNQLQFAATVTNRGTTDLKVLKYSTILDDMLPTKSFNISKGNMTVPFTGLKVFLSLPALNSSAFTVIPAGQSIVVYHNGAGNFTFQPIVNFQALPASQNYVAGVTSLNSVNVVSNNMTIAVTQTVTRREHQDLNRRAMDVCSVTAQKTFVDSSYVEGKALAAWASSYISAHGMDALYTSYWGNTSTSNITAIYNAVASENSTTRTDADCLLYLQITHAVAGTDDISYGCAADQALPAQLALMNADNFNT
ncbi:hypothetical protein H0H92_004141 [Tricholoma furcatifolium]|nr:hypothetical protein H0H92_004141 [Tricholoma furcatifolium]